MTGRERKGSRANCATISWVRKLATKLLTAQALAHTSFLWLRFPRALDQFDLVALRRVDERDFTAASRMRPIGQRITFCFRFLRELFQIVHFKCEVRQVGADHYRTALVKFTNLNLPIAVG